MAQVNLVAPTLCCRLAVEAMAAAREGGRWGEGGKGPGRRGTSSTS